MSSLGRSQDSCGSWARPLPFLVWALASDQAGFPCPPRATVGGQGCTKCATDTEENRGLPFLFLFPCIFFVIFYFFCKMSRFFHNL